MNRRNFLKISATAGTGLAVTLPAFSQGTDPKPIPMRKLGKTGLTLPILSMGVMNADNPNILKAAYDAGVKFFDTANSYQSGRNETMLGEFFKDKPRNSFYVGTKVGLRGDLNNPAIISGFLTSFETSLKRLQLDYVDIFYVHSGAPEVAKHPEVLTALDNLKKAGKVKFIGISTHSQEAAVINNMLDAKVWDVVLSSCYYKQNYHADLFPAMQKAHDAGMGIIAMKTMAGGAFLDRARTQPNNVPAAFKWVLQHDFIHTAIPGFNNFEQLESCLAAVRSLELNEEEKAFLGNVAYNRSGDIMCQQCGQCVGQCPRHLPIPDMMRAYMYTYGYKSASMGQETLASLNLPTDACSGCEECSVQCASGFNIAYKMQDIARLQQIPREFLV